MLTMKNKLKSTRAVTYRRCGIPAVILEGKWLTEKYRLLIGDVVDIDYQPKEIRLQKNSVLSLQCQKERKTKLDRKQRIKESAHDTITNQDENAGSRSVEVSEG